MQIKLNGKLIESKLIQSKVVSDPVSTQVPAIPVNREYSDAEGYAVMITGFGVVAALLKYWGWF